MRVYLDSSAILKRAIDEPESEALETALKSLSDSTLLITSELALVEVLRALRTRLDAEDPRLLTQLADDAFGRIHTSPISDQVISISRRLGPSVLRSLDAIHLATATLVDADIIYAYDRRMLQAAAENGFAVASPGLR